MAGRLVVDSVAIVGNARVAEAQIRADIGVAPGDTIDYSAVQRAMHRLWATRQFSNVDVFLSGDPQNPTAPVELRVEVTEHPIVAQIEFTGLEHLRGSTVRDTVGLRAGQPYNPANVAEAEAMIRTLLAQQGFQVRSIESELIDIADRPGEKRLVFNVREGSRVAIADVEFIGNERFEDEDLAESMATREEGFLWNRPGTIDDDELRNDLRAQLPLFYASNGYLDFSVVRDSLVVDEVTGKARLIIEVSEGPQYLLAGFDVRGNRTFASEDLRRYFDAGRSTGLLRTIGIGGGQVRSDSLFDLNAFQSATDEVRRLYNNAGYLYAQVEPVIERLPATDSSAPQVRVAWQIQEGQPAYIRRVAIEGNTFTHEDVIRNQILIVPGDVYSEELLIQSYRRVGALGFFETPMPAPRIVPDPETGDVDVTFVVTERQTGSVNFGTALGGVSGISGFLGYDQPNLFGKAKSGHLRWEFGTYSNNFEASYADPQILDTDFSGSLSVFSSRDRFIQFPEGRRRRTGASIRFGLPLPTDRRFSRVVVGYGLSRTTYEQFEAETASSLFQTPPGLQSTLTLGLQRTTVDHPLFPTVGTSLNLNADFNGGVLGGDGEFQKYTVEGGWHVPVGSVGGGAPGARPLRFTLGLQAEAGAIFGDASRFPFDRFWLGGVQFGRPLRGYDETTITPIGFVPRCTQGNDCPPLEDRIGDAYVRLSAEYAVRFNDNISLGLFYDAGGVWREPSEINPSKLLRGAGIGATVITPFGPLGLDYAYGFDKPGTENRWQLHFKFGQGM